MFGVIARRSCRLLTQTRAVARVPPVSNLARVNAALVSRRALSSTTEESQDDISSLPDNRFEGVGQPFDKRIAGILSQPLDDAEVGFHGLQWVRRYNSFSELFFYVSILYSGLPYCCLAVLSKI